MVEHGYFGKEMKSQLMLEKKSAMSIKQKQCIQANELARSSYNLKMNDMEEEVEKVIEAYTRQCKNSGWERKEVKEMVINGYNGWQRRVARRIEKSGTKYRSGGKTLVLKTRKKLTGKEDWYKEESRKRKRENDELKYEPRAEKPWKSRSTTASPPPRATACQ